ncbi:MAG: Sporulation kinase E [Syntrophorhabdus sp. PtaB.Bin006]|nr:MAG: Sporulation kinase E [Syntrophorhabdus sp. PtaB.Bin006]
MRIFLEVFVKFADLEIGLDERQKVTIESESGKRATNFGRGGDRQTGQNRVGTHGNAGQGAYSKGRLFSVIVLACLIVLAGMATLGRGAELSNQTKHVLLINAYHQGYRWTDSVVSGVESVLKDGHSDIELHIEYMDSKRISDPSHFFHLSRYYRFRFNQVKFDLIIVSDNDAFDFIMRYRDSLFPGVPVVFCGISSTNESLQGKIPFVTGVVEDYDIKATLDIAFKLHPHAKEVIGVGNRTPLGEVKKRLFNEALSGERKTVKNTFFDDPVLSDFENIIRSKGKECIILLLGNFRDGEGNVIPAEESTRLLAKLGIPLYGALDYYLGYGIVGGKIINGYDQGATAARIGLRILNGEPADRIPIERKSPNRYMFDYAAMSRFGISQAQLPEGSTIINKPKPSRSESRTVSWGAIVPGLLCLGVVVVLFSVLLIRSRRRQKDSLKQLSADMEKQVEARTEELTRINAELRTKVTELEKAESTVTELKQRQDSLGLREEMTAQILDRLPVRLLVARRDATIERLSQGLVHTFGYTGEDVPTMGQWWEKACPDRALRETLSSAWLDSAGRERSLEDPTRSFVGRVAAKDGSVFDMEIRFLPVQDRVVTIFSDVGKQSGSIRPSRSRDFESIGTLAAGIAHDFNNLLLVILGSISLAKTSLTPGDRAYERLIDAEKASMMTKDLIQQLITFSKGGQLSKRSLAIAPLMMDVTHATLSGSNIKGRYIMSDDLLPVEADEGQIRQVMQIILRNAREAMPLGGTVTLSFDNVTVTRKDYLPLSDGDYVKVSIQDEGAGIKEDHLSRIFDPYFTTKDKGDHKGVGLGLAIAFSIIKNHNGHIAVESRVGGGTIFHLYLPASGKEGDTCEEEEEMVIPVAKGKGRILVMDDAKAVRDVTGAMLSHIGYDVAFATDGREAIALYRQAMEENEPFDLVILDMTVQAGMGGMETFQILRGIDPEVKAIISSGYSGDPIMTEYEECGFKRAIMKPYKMDELEDVLKGLTNPS